MKSFSRKALFLLATVLSCSFMPAWSSHQSIWENEDNAKTQVARIRKDSYSVQLSSFAIQAGKKGSDVASEELNRLTNVAKQKGYDLSKHDLFSVKAKNDHYAYCAVGSFHQHKDADLLCTYLGTIFPSKPIVKNPTNIDNVLLDFVIYRSAKR